MKKTVFIVLLLLLLFSIQLVLEKKLDLKPACEKVGLVANPYVMRLISADHKETVASLLAVKSLIYYGTMVDEQRRNDTIQVDYDGLYNVLHTASRLDPYNMDIYYFSQSILGWKVEYVKRVVELLDYGMNFRTWDWMLPFWAGFNSVNFLHDYRSAADYYAQAGELSSADIFDRLSARYLYESDQTARAIAYLETMIKSAGTSSIKQSFEKRLLAFRQIDKIENAIKSFKIHTGKEPKKISELIRLKYLKTIPVDPYGGKFYLDNNGKPRTTSAFASISK